MVGLLLARMSVPSMEKMVKKILIFCIVFLHFCYICTFYSFFFSLQKLHPCFLAIEYAQMKEIQ